MPTPTVSQQRWTIRHRCLWSASIYGDIGPECGSSRLLSPSIAAKWNCLTVFLTARALNLQEFIMPNQFSKTAIDDGVGVTETIADC